MAAEHSLAFSEPSAGRIARGTERGPSIALVASIWMLSLAPDSGIPVHIIAAVYSAVIVMTLIGLWSVRHEVRGSYAVGALTLYYIVLLVATLAAGTSHPIARLLLNGCAMVGVCANSMTMKPSRRISVYRGIVMLAMFESAVALSQKFYNSPVIWGYLGTVHEAVHATNPIWSSPDGRAMGTLSHPIPLALLLGAALLVVLTSPAIQRKHFRVLVVCILAAAIFSTGTRSAILALIPTLGFVGMGNRTSRNRWLWNSLAVLACIVVALKVNITHLSVISSLNNSTSFEHRAGALGDLQTLFAESPLHVLFGNGRASIAQLVGDAAAAQDITVVDNNVVTVIAMAGIIGLVALARLIGVGFMRGDRTSRAALIFIVLMFFSFDVSLWAPSSALLIFFASTRRLDDSVGLGTELENGPNSGGTRQLIVSGRRLTTPQGRSKRRRPPTRPLPPSTERSSSPRR